VEVMGRERVMLGSDYPYPLGEQRVGHLVANCSRIDAQTKAAILGGNAVKFWNIPK
jgi:aminocarboxymuconate-semialdehyde decarboxylase